MHSPPIYCLFVACFCCGSLVRFIYLLPVGILVSIFWFGAIDGLEGGKCGVRELWDYAPADIDKTKKSPLPSRAARVGVMWVGSNCLAALPVPLQI